MSIEPDRPADGPPPPVDALLARASFADARHDRRRAGAIRDVAIAQDARLSDQTRAAVMTAAATLVGTVANQIAFHAARTLRAKGEERLAEAIVATDAFALDRLIARGVLADPALIAELVGRAEQDRLAAMLPVVAPDSADRPSLLARLVDDPDPLVAEQALALLVAESRRRAPDTASRLARTDLPAERQHVLVWHIAVAMRDRFADDRAIASLDRALADGAARCLAAHDEGVGVEAAALRLAAAIGSDHGGLGALCLEALADRQLALVIAMIAHGLQLEFEVVREIVLDPAGDRLVILLRALDLPRESIGQIGWALAEADPRRDGETLGDLLDAAMALAPARAHAALAPLMLPADYRAAMRGGDSETGR